MANTNPKLNIDAIDFDNIKQNLKSYLQSQDQFKDYDFEGSGLNILLDVLAYNTHYNAFYANMVANETFLDSALTYESASSIAKHLNYVPKSYRSAVAYVDVKLLNRTDTQKTSIANGAVFINAGDRFITNTGSKIYVFTATKTVQVVKDGDSYIARNVEIKEGASKTITYVYDDVNQNVDQKFVIPEQNVDTTSIEVRVSNSVLDTSGIENIWKQSTDITTASSESLVYFLQQNSDLNYEIYFGDGIVGKKPNNGNVITITYRVTAGSVCNGIGANDTSSNPAFRYLEDSKSLTNLVVDSNNKPETTFGGSDPETINSIKYYAPRNYQSQERAVTAEDYRTILSRDYSEQAESVFVWGGEENNPPVYGKVFISIKPKNAERLTQLEKISIAKNIIKQKNVVSIIPEIVDPDYLYLIFNVTSKYDTSKTTLTQNTLSENIKSLLYLYSLDNIGKFEQDFVYSLFISYINDTFNPPVTSNSIDIKLKKKLSPSLTVNTSYVVDFDNELYHPIDGYSSILTSTVFGFQDSTSNSTIKPNVDAYLDDDGLGNIRVYKLLNGTKVYLNNSIGTIDYNTGKISLLNFVPQYLKEQQTTIDLTVIPKSPDVSARRNQILILNSDDITVNSIPQTPKTSSASGVSFI